MSTATGVVEKVLQRGNMYSINVSGTWYGCGRDKPDCSEGQTVSFEYSMNGKYKNADVKSLEVQSSTPAQSKGVDPSVWVKKDAAIIYQAARNSAIAFIDILCREGALALPQTKDKKFDAMMALLDQMTNDFYLNTDKVRDNGGLTAEDLVGDSSSKEEEF